MGLVKRLLIIFTFIFMGSLFANPVLAQGLATVDARLLLILHPKMADFDYSNGRFFKTKVKYDNLEDLSLQLSKAREQAEEENAAVAARIKELESEKFEVTRALIREEQFFAPGDLKAMQKEKQDLETAVLELNRKKIETSDEADLQSVKLKDLKERIGNIEAALSNSANMEIRHEVVAKLKSQIEAINVKIALCADEIRQNNEKAVSIIYFTTEETDEKVATIREELKKLMESTAKAKNLGIIIDNSYALQTKLNKTKNSMIPAVDENLDVVSASLFHSFVNYEMDSALEAILDMPDTTETAAQHLLAGRSDGLENNMKQYLQYREYLPDRLANFTNGNIFLSGGTDITLDCAQKLFADYKVPDSLKRKYLNVLTEHLEFYK